MFKGTIANIRYAPRAPFIAPSRNIADAYLGYLIGRTDPADIQKLKNNTDALYGTSRVVKDGETVTTRGILSGGDGFGNEKKAIYQFYQQRDAQLAEYDAKKAAQDAVVEQKKAEVAQTNVANAQASAAQRRRGGGTATPRSGLLGLPIVDLQQAMSRKYGI